MNSLTATRELSVRQFVVFMSAVFAMGSLAIDSVLPTLPQISRDLHLENANHAQFIVTSFALGMGLGNLLGGPLSDTYGRRSVILSGCALYALTALAGCFIPTLGLMLVARVLQGVGACLVSVAATALVRDTHSGAAMARIMSFAMVLFAMMPAVAPFLGQVIAALAGWRTIFAVFAGFGALLTLYAANLVPETPERARSGLAVMTLIDRARQALAFSDVRRSIAVQTLNFAILFSMISSIQPIFDKSFGRAAGFPAYFALMALAIAAAGVLNGRFVESVGAARVVRLALGGGTLVSAGAVALAHFGALGAGESFVLFIVWAIVVFFMFGSSIGNLSALAMEPAGHLAGMASTLIAAVPMIVGSALAMPVGLAFDGTPAPLMAATLLFAAIGYALSRSLGTGDERPRDADFASLRERG